MSEETNVNGAFDTTVESPSIQPESNAQPEPIKSPPIPAARGVSVESVATALEVELGIAPGDAERMADIHWADGKLPIKISGKSDVFDAALNVLYSERDNVNERD